MPNEEQIILVDTGDAQVGAMGKLETHEKGLLHRVFSIFIFNAKGEVMLQKRAFDKYHSGGLWSNTCCGHPRNGEELMSAARRRLKEEMGFDCPLQELFVFHYQTIVPTPKIELQENEMNHVLVGEYNDVPVLNPEEASDWRWATLDEIKSDVSKNPDNYTYWFKIILGKQELNSMLYRFIQI
ncbi:MAG: isopentenyl-diphosphate Delta-isomerase [Candidatus Uhrbacteria bacterium]|nr:isopentenyl-diphosphate Delta-isomerase [Candidatus Uhrbacteria bacterium]